MSKIKLRLKQLLEYSPAALCVLFLIFVIALVRLAWMQIPHHTDYEEFYNERFGEQQNKFLSDVVDKTGNKILSQALKVNLEVDYSTSAIAALSYEQNMSCGEKGGRLEKPWFFSKKYKYVPGCDAYRAVNYEDAITGIDRFKKDNPWLNLEQCRRIKTPKRYFYSCRDIEFADYRSAQSKLEKLYELRRQIYGFKFTTPTGVLGKICSTAYKKTQWNVSDFKGESSDSVDLESMLEKTKLSQLDLSRYEEKNISDKNQTIHDYCKKNDTDFIEIGLILSDIYEKNTFTPQLLEEAVSKISSENRLEEDDEKTDGKEELIKSLFCLDNPEHKLCKVFHKTGTFDLDSAMQVILSKGYCSEKYQSRLCRELYKHNLDSIAEFFKKAEIPNTDYYQISDIINEAKSTFPHSTVIISSENNKVISNKYSWWRHPGYLKHKKDYYIETAGKKDEYLFNKGKFRKKFTDYSGIERIKNQDEIFWEISKDIGIGKEKNYVKLARVSKKDFNEALPEVYYYRGAYSMSGIDFPIEEGYFNMRKIAYNTDNQDKENDSADYMLAPYLQTEHNGENILQVAYKPTLRGGSEIKNFTGIAAKHIEKLKKEDVQLTIDSRIQMFADRALHKKCEEMKADRGFLLVQNVHTGEMIAVSEYSVDPIINAQGKREPKDFGPDFYRHWLNGDPPLALNRIYKPGSTFKPFAAAFALEGGFIKKDSVFKVAKDFVALKNSEDSVISKAWCGIHEEGYKAKDKTCDKNDTTYIDSTLNYTLDEIIARSSNVGISLVTYEAWKAGKSEYMEQMAEKFGFVSRTGFGEESNVKELPGQVASMKDKDKNGNPVPKPESEILKDYLKKSYGQGGLEVSPIALITAYSALVNGGLLPKPYMVYQKNAPKRRRVISADVSEQVRKWMYAVLQPGTMHTGQNLNLSEAGGKSGTADMFNKPGGPNLASFIAFYPNSADGKTIPQYIVLAIIDENKYGSHAQGAAAAGPLAKAVIEEMRRLEYK